MKKSNVASFLPDSWQAQFAWRPAKCMQVHARAIEGRVRTKFLLHVIYSEILISPAE